MTQHQPKVTSRPGRARLRAVPPRFPAAGLALLLLGLLAQGATAQGFTGTYVGVTPAGEVTITLEQAGEDLSGTLSGPGIELSLLGVTQGEAAGGLAFTADEAIAFEVHLQGDSLILYLYELDARGNPVEATAIELALARRAAPTLGGRPQAPPPSENPGTPPTPANATDPVLATGAHATLTLDNAKAFIEALEFVLDQIGYAYELTDEDRAQALEELKAAYPQLDPEEQVLLAQSREVWERVQANWEHADISEREEFALGVLVLAFGEDTVRSWISSASSGGGGLGSGSSCETFEDCTSSFVDQQTWSDTFNTQGCWAAAGCGGYDPSTNTFSYDGY